jgi:hypothetical protein
LCFAPSGSNAEALAYANRSIVYLEMGHYEKALENIELARSRNYPKEKLDKLTQREDNCLDLMNNRPQNNPYKQIEIALENFLIPTRPGHKKMPCYVADCLELKKNAQFGRHIVTNTDLKVGTVLAVEEPFSKMLLPGSCYERCANCLAKNLLNLFPCEYCTSTMFCSEECKKTALENFHQYECAIADILDVAFPQTPLLALHTFFEALNIFNQDPVALSEALKNVENTDGTIFDFDFSKLSKSDQKKASLQAVNSLMPENSTNSNKMLIQRFTVCAILCNLVQNSTKLGLILNEEAAIMFRRFIFQHIQIGNLNSHALYGYDKRSLIELGKYAATGENALILHQNCLHYFKFQIH